VNRYLETRCKHAPVHALDARLAEVLHLRVRRQRPDQAEQSGDRELQSRSATEGARAFALTWPGDTSMAPLQERRGRPSSAVSSPREPRNERSSALSV